MRKQLEGHRRARGLLVVAGALAAVAAVAAVLVPDAVGGTPSARPGPRVAQGGDIHGLRQGSVPAISRAEIIQRAQYWLNLGVPYDRGAYNSVPGPDGATYTPDCSGYASMVWNLGTSYGSGSLPGVAVKLGSTNDLLRGDILVAQVGAGKPTGHVAIFDKWADSGRTRYWGYDHGGPKGAPPRYAVFAVDRPNDGRVYVPYRHPNLSDANDPAPAPGDFSQPDGDINDVIGQPGRIYVRGWAVDADTPTTPVDVHIYLTFPDGQRRMVRNVNAALSRPDVADVYPQYGPTHGFEVFLSGLPAGRYGVEAFGIDTSGQAEDYAQLRYGRTVPKRFVNVA